MYLRIILSILSITFFMAVFQNCDGGMFLPDAGLGGSFSSSGGAQSTFRSIADGHNSENPPLAELTGGRLQLKGLNWFVEWADEFDGPYGSKVKKPWYYAMRPQSGNRHRHGVLTEQDAFLDGRSHLMMRTVMRDGQPSHSFLRSANFDKGDMSKDFPDNYLLDPTKGPLYIEASIRLDRAYQSEDAWWAFWLFAPNTWDKNANRLWSSFTPNSPRLDPYDINPQTGMEVDIFEYVPYLGNSPYESRNGFNMAVFTSYDPDVSLHMKTSLEGGFVPDINRYLTNFKKAPPKNIYLTDGNYHKIGMYWDNFRYEFYIDGILIWEVTDPRFITKTRANAIILSWEVQNDLWGDKASKTFESNNKEVFVLIDYVRVYRAR